jgi:hypothetical protein
MEIKQMTNENDKVRIKHFTQEKPKINDLELMFSKNIDDTGFEIEIKIKASSKMTSEMTNYLAVNISQSIKRVFSNYELK